MNFHDFITFQFRRHFYEEKSAEVILAASVCIPIFCINFSDFCRLGVNYFEKVINYIQLHWKLFN